LASALECLKDRPNYQVRGVKWNFAFAFAVDLNGNGSRLCGGNFQIVIKSKGDAKGVKTWT
jgi:hypothetical protein